MRLRCFPAYSSEFPASRVSGAITLAGRLIVWSRSFPITVIRGYTPALTRLEKLPIPESNAVHALAVNDGSVKDRQQERSRADPPRTAETARVALLGVTRGQKTITLGDALGPISTSRRASLEYNRNAVAVF